MKNVMFDRAVMKLTAWYVGLVVLISLLCSVVVYQAANVEFGRMAAPPRFDRVGEAGQLWQQEREERAVQGRANLLGSLLVFNLSTLAIGAVFSYLLARRTLTPIAEAHHAQGRFVSDAAHELRSPLAVMKSEAEVALRDKATTKQELREVVESSLAEVDRLSQLTDRLLTLASTESFVLRSTALTPLVEKALQHSQAKARQRDITLIAKTFDLSAVTHPEALIDLLTILIDNAIKYSPQQSTVTVRLVHEDRRAAIQVIDQGPGIADAQKQQIFERFYRLDESRSSLNEHGYGLGLSIAAKLAHSLRAKINVTDNQPTGSIFTVWFSRI